MGINSAPYEVIEDENIFDIARTSQGVNLSPGNYEGGMRYIAILQRRDKQKKETTTEEAQFELRSELGEIMRIARIARPGALYDASVTAQTFETIDVTIISPTDFEGIVDVNSTTVIGANSYARIPGFGGFRRNSSKSANRVNLMKKRKKVDKSKNHLRCGIFCTC